MIIVKRIALLLFFTTLLFIQAWAQASDEQVIKLLQDAQKRGMSQQQVAVMLMQQGVTKEQIQRLKAQYENGQLNVGKDTDKGRLRTSVSDTKGKTDVTGEKNISSKNNFIGNIDDKRAYPIDTLSYYMDQSEIVKQKTTGQRAIFGMDIFNNALLTFEPQLNIATPDNYVLGPGDEVIVDVWGASEATVRQTISPDGNIIVEGIGPLHLSGLTAKEANGRVRNAFENIYAGIGQQNTFVKLTLGEIRSIKVNVMGEIATPGTYTLPSLASAFHALYSAGGVNDIGSLRSMKIYRKGKEMAEVDVYDYIMRGKSDLDVVLQDGDIIVVSPYQNMVEVKGKVKRPMTYEMRNNETLADLLKYTGGFTGDAYKENIRIIRKSGREYQVYNIDKEGYGDFALIDGDAVEVEAVIPRFENKAEIRGAVYREGLYAIGDKVNTVGKLIEKAEGIKGDAFLNRAVLYREKPDLTMEVMSVDLAGLLNGKVEDIPLQKNDVLYIPSIFDLREEYTVAIKGAVGFPGTYKFVDNMTLEDAIVQSGGLLESASTIKVDVARRIKDPKSTITGNLRAETYSFTLKDGLMVDGQQDFVLKPFDEIIFRYSPGYQEQQNVFINGEVLFTGEYALEQKGERLSDLVKKAGGLTAEAYVEGAKLMRKSTPEEKASVMQTIAQMDRQDGKDSLNLEQLKLGDHYRVGIDLKQALAKPGADGDIILREGDRLVIPEYDGTVRIRGAVMYPNTVSYKGKAKLKYYIEQAGGYAQRAKKKRAFVVNMNGTVAIAKGNMVVKPGCEIIVPMKQARKGMGLTEIMSLASSTTSMAAMVTSILNMTK